MRVMTREHLLGPERRREGQQEDDHGKASREEHGKPVTRDVER
jgi:hypothetical protein